MLDLLQSYTIQQILIFIVILGLAVKGIITFYDWAVMKTRELVHNSEKPDKLKEQIQNHGQEIDDIKQMIRAMSAKIDILVESDKDDIKAFITREHHYFCYQKGWIDDYSLDCIEKRFGHYREEKGNSFIASLIDEIRALPKQPQDLSEEQNPSSSGVH